METSKTVLVWWRRSSEPTQDVRWEIFPSEILGGVQVYKTQDASLIPGGIAATIDIRTTDPLDYEGPSIQLRAGPTYNDEADNLPHYDGAGYRGSAGYITHLSDNFAIALAGSIQRGLQQQFAGFRMRGGADHARDRERRETLQSRGLHQIQRKIVGHNAAHRNANQNVLYDQHERNQRRQNPAGSRHGQRLQNILKRHGCARPHAAKIGPRSARLRRTHTDAHSEIGRRRSRRHGCKANRQATEALQLHVAIFAADQMFTDHAMLLRRNRTVEISREVTFSLAAIHRRPLNDRAET